MNKKQKAIEEFQTIHNNAEMKALSKVSLERELTNKEFKRYKKLFDAKR